MIVFIDSGVLGLFTTPIKSFTGCKHRNQIEFYGCDAPITSGSLIYIDKAKTIHPPHADLFIDGIDLDYGLQLKQKKYYNLIITQAIMWHHFGELHTINYL